MNTRLGLISAYSLLYGVHMPAVLLDKAGASTVSICDLNNLYGVHSFLEEAKIRNIRPVIGVSLTETSGISSDNIHCFAENRRGFTRLCEILSIRNKDIKNFKALPLLREDSNGLVIASVNNETLKTLAGNVKHLYCAITCDDLSALQCHSALNLPLAFLDTSVFLAPEDYKVHRVLRAIGLNKTTGSLSSSDTLAMGKGIFKTETQLAGLFNSWPESVQGTAKIAEICQFNEIFDGLIFPGYGENPCAELRQRVYAGAVLRYGELGDMEIDRIEYELDVIETMGFSSYFLRLDDIVGMVSGSRTCGRGSAAASIVSYSLGITNVDPIAHNLYFERFLNPARPDPPDIDVDFAWDERDGLIKSVIDKFGNDYCARVANHNFFRPRSALRETAKAYGFPDAEITKLEKKLFVLREKDEKTDPLWNEIYEIASKIEGLPRGLSMHCGGIVITPKPVSSYAPVEKSLEGFPLLSWEKEGAEAAGFVKIDLLGNRSLAVIRDALINLDENGIYINRNTWRPIDDKMTIEALARGDSIGVFYVESPAMRQLQKKTGRGDFDHIVIHSSIIRPAANKFISEYVRRLKGGAWEALHPRLDKILNESYGILCYQEDVSKTAAALAGFDEVSADKLRKVIAKKAGAEKLKVYENQFFEGCRNNKVDEKTIKEIWSMMLSFDGYSFCKPHSASYAMVSYQSAYLRVHHPAEFMAAVISNQGGYYRPGAYISECRRMLLLTEGPDINISLWKYYGKARCVVIGFMSIKGLSVSGVNQILNDREKKGPYKNLDDFASRVKLSRDDIESLCPAGVFDSISCGLPRAMQARFLLKAKPASDQNELFSSEPKRSVSLSMSLKTGKKNDIEIWEEFHSLGFLRNTHPLALWKDKLLSVKNRVKAAHIHNYVNRSLCLAGLPVTQKEVWTKDGLTMSFLSFEDETALYETVIFPDIYKRYSKLLFDFNPLLVYGIVKEDQGAIILEVTRIERL
ncbi:MAG: DNA polymerase III subunit alpha [Treponema sp.]|nr:DNA polymerase III subunit alpha [Treponema sp.]